MKAILYGQKLGLVLGLFAKSFGLDFDHLIVIFTFF